MYILSFRLPVMPQCNLLWGYSPDCSESYTVGAPHPGTALLGCISLKAVAVLPHQSVLREESRSSLQTFQSLYCPPARAGASPDFSGQVLVKKAIWVTKFVINLLGASAQRVLLPGVVPSNKIRPSSVQKKEIFLL